MADSDVSGRVPSAPGSQASGHAGCAVDGASRFDPSRDPTPDPFWLILTSENQAIRFSFDNGNYAMDFRVFGAAEAFYEGSEVGAWELFDGNDGHPLEEWEKAFCEIDGAVKWDGCINWQTNPECMMHGCGPRHVGEISAIFSAVYSAGSWFFDYLGDAPPPMPEGTINVRDSDRHPEGDETPTAAQSSEAR